MRVEHERACSRQYLKALITTRRTEQTFVPRMCKFVLSQVEIVGETLVANVALEGARVFPVASLMPRQVTLFSVTFAADWTRKRLLPSMNASVV